MSKKTVAIVNHKELLDFINSLARRSSDIQGRVGPTLKQLWASERENKSIVKEIDFTAFERSFPQFKEVIKYLKLQITMSVRLDRPFKISPILLLGDAGLAKTYFASELAKLLELSYFELSFATVTANFVISGGNTQWGEGKAGFILESMAKSEIANPIILIDEIDKAGGSQHYTPINVFYALLEPHSASKFKDEAIPINLDASNINWIATANERVDIKAPILSRMKVFEIHQPSPEDMLGVIDSIYVTLIRRGELESLLTQEVSDQVKQRLSTLSPRLVRIALEEAIMSALFDQRDHIVISDLPKVGVQEVRRVGFL